MTVTVQAALHTTAFDRFVSALEGHGNIVRPRGDGRAQATCPAHDDSNPSLSISLRADGKGIVLKCHAGCDTRDVVAALGLTMADLFDDHDMRNVFHDRATYDFPGGRRVHRKPGKRFHQTGNMADRTLYHQDRIAGATEVLVVEGERDVHAAEAVGAAAVSSAQGAKKAHLAEWSALQGKAVTIVVDKDEAGREHAAQVAAILRPIATCIRFVEAKIGKDLADHIAAGHTIDELVEIVITIDTPPEIDGAQLLDDVTAFLGRFVSYPSTHARNAHALWIPHTWLMDCWDSTPRIAFLSPEPASGKSRALEVTEPLVPRPVHAVNVTPNYLFRKVSDEAGAPTILYDEIDTVFGPKAKEHEDTRGMLNSGHRKGATAGRCVIRGKEIETQEFPSYCAVALAGLNDLPDTIMTRSVIVRMRRRAPDEPVQPWRPRINGPDAEDLRTRITDWAASVREKAREYWPEMPVEVQDRSADVWEALISVADLAGGHWPETARRSAVALVADSRAGEPSLGVQLLRDIKTAFTRRGDERLNLTTAELLTDLRGIPESPWATVGRSESGLDARGLAKHLANYGVKSKNMRYLGSVAKGYIRDDFQDAWHRYVAPEPEEGEA